MADETQQAEKPPAQIISAGGFSVSKPMGEAIDWPALFRLPPFQKFVDEQAPNRMGVPSDMYSAQFTQHACEQMGAEAFYARYCEWHARTGMWPRERPDGKLKEHVA